MKKITESQFKELLARNDWTRKQEIEEAYRDLNDIHFIKGMEKFAYCEEFEEVGVTQVVGGGKKISTLDDITITYDEVYYYNAFDSSSFETSTESQSEIFSIEGAVIVDDDDENEKIILDDIDYLYDYSDFSDIDYSELIDSIDQVIKIDCSDDDDEDDEEDDDGMKIYEISVNDAPDVKFKGKRIAFASDVEAFSANFVKTYISLFRSKSGKFLCFCDLGDAYNSYTSFKLCETEEEVINFFGHEWYAKELYDEAGIEYIEEEDTEDSE